MSIKKKLGMGIATAVLGIGLIGGGTYAYFSDTAQANGSFVAGTLDLKANPSTIINLENLKPGDWMNRSFKLENGGTLDIGKILLETSYTVNDLHEDNGDDFGKHINVTFFRGENHSLLGILSAEQEVFQTTLNELQSMTLDSVINDMEGISGLKAGDSVEFFVQFEFVENNKDQNQFQGDSVKLEWTFEGHQTNGERR
ncbi:TasA family protein [Virgibacillus byunsanensis]|uniref:TasA family protein n=1 Tax=Virgibacillus byunsanensis TaxID=570945 RepID=A0ABW3LQ73_9BACI